jgi:hypothetical protein
LLTCGALAACAQATSATEQEKRQAVQACEHEAQRLFPDLTNGAYELSVGELRFESADNANDGQFLVAGRNMQRNATTPFLLRCTGNTRTRTIGRIEFDGISKTPDAGQDWSY